MVGCQERHRISFHLVYALPPSPAANLSPVTFFTLRHSPLLLATVRYRPSLFVIFRYSQELERKKEAEAVDRRLTHLEALLADQANKLNVLVEGLLLQSQPDLAAKALVPPPAPPLPPPPVDPEEEEEQREAPLQPLSSAASTKKVSIVAGEAEAASIAGEAVDAGLSA